MNDRRTGAGYGGGVQPLRAALRRKPLLAAMIVLAALLLRVVVPAGFMPVMDGRGVTLTLCPGVSPVVPAAQAMPGMAHHDDGAAKAGSPCAYADLALPAIGGADPIQLAAALAFIFAAALLLRGAPPPQAATRLRPPLRGPPIPA